MGKDPNKTNAQISLIRENLYKGTFNNQSTSDLQSIVETQISGNKIIINPGSGTININASGCTLSQDVVLKIIVQNTVTNAFVRALQGVDLPTIFPPPANTEYYKALYWTLVILTILAPLILYYIFVIRKNANKPKFSFY
jgi:hypothetical protein